MSTCTRCGATFSCAMADDGASDQPCWCTELPPVVPVPGSATEGASCWCPACLRAHIEEVAKAATVAKGSGEGCARSSQ